MRDQLTVGIAQIAPVWLNRGATLTKIIEQTTNAADAGCQLVVFGEALLPGYPIWIDWTDGSRFNSPLQKRIHAHYVDQAVDIAGGDLQPLQQVAAARKIAIYRARLNGRRIVVATASTVYSSTLMPPAPFNRFTAS